MELVIPYLLIIFGVPADGEAEIVHRQLAISEDACQQLLEEQRTQWADDKVQTHHLVCMRLPGEEEFATLFREAL